MRMLKNELYKSTHNGFFKVSLLVGFIIQLYSFKDFFEYMVDMYLPSPRNGYNLPQVVIGEGVYFNWIGHEAASSGAHMAKFLLPLIAVLPYGWSFCNELHGYHHQMICRVGKTKYFSAKYLASFISGGLAIAFMMLSNFVFCSFIGILDVPITWSMFSRVYRGMIGSKLFYTYPFAFVLLWTLIAALFGGALSGLVMFFAQIIDSSVFVMIASFVTPILYDNIMYLLTQTNEYSMMINYSSGSATYNQSIIFAQIIALIAVGYLGGLLLYRRRDALT